MYQTNLYGDLVRDSQIRVNQFLYDVKLVVDYLDQYEYDKIHLSMLNKKIVDKLKVYETLSLDKLYLIFEYLREHNQLQKTYNGTVYACPECGSFIAKITCESCGSEEIREVRKMVHQRCGHIETLDMFIDRDYFMCKSCGMEIDYTRDGGVDGDYRFCDITYECMECGEVVKKYQNLSKLIRCTKCENTFNNTQLKIIDLSIYQRKEISNFP